MAILGLGGRPNVVVINPTVVAEWGAQSTSISYGSGAPSGNLGTTYYFNLDNFDLYVWDGASWSGPMGFTYSTDDPSPTFTEVGANDYWVKGSFDFSAIYGIWGPRTLVNVPSDNDVIAWDASSNSWVAASLSSLLAP